MSQFCNLFKSARELTVCTVVMISLRLGMSTVSPIYHRHRISPQCARTIESESDVVVAPIPRLTVNGGNVAAMIKSTDKVQWETLMRPLVTGDKIKLTARSIGVYRNVRFISD